MKILITGGTGLIGKKLSKLLFQQGHDLFLTTRSPQSIWKKIDVPCTALSWPLKDSNLEELSEIDAVINLMGESIAEGRWNEKKKQSLHTSRVDNTRSLFEALSRANAPLKTWINASAIGYYGADPNNKYDEDSPAGQDFLAQLGKAWEDATNDTAYPPNPDLRRVILRIGVVLSTEGGALEKMLPPFENHLGGKLSHGKQWFSWVHIDDMLGIILKALEDETMSGPYNAVAPEPVSNQNFTKTLGQVLQRLTPFPVPSIMLKLILGEMSTLLLDGHHVMPKRLLEHYDFKYPNLKVALEHLLDGYSTGQHKYETAIWLPQDINTLFEYFCEAKNLEELTPDMLHFKVVGMSTDQIQEGTLLDYHLKIHGIPQKWQTLIERWEPPHCFVDTQLKGPYSLWHHTHTFEELRGGTLMTDTVLYRPPLGPLGRLAELLFIKKDVHNIFNYRRKVIRERFQT